MPTSAAGVTADGGVATGAEPADGAAVGVTTGAEPAADGATADGATGGGDAGAGAGLDSHAARVKTRSVDTAVRMGDTLPHVPDTWPAACTAGVMDRVSLLFFAVLAAAGCAAPDPSLDLESTGEGAISGADGGSPSPLPSPATAADGGRNLDTRGTLDASIEGAVPGSTSSAEPDASAEPDEGRAPWTPTTVGSNVFAGADPYREFVPTRRARDRHADSVSGKDCATCHNGFGAAPAFDFAGTIYRSLRGTEPAAGAEIRIVQPNGMAVSVHADADGNFWHFGTIPAARGSLSGARSARASAVGRLNGASCNTSSCHGPSRRLYIP